MKRRAVNKLIMFLKERYGKNVQNRPLNNKEVFKILITTVLSQRTRDENSEKAAQQLFSVARTPNQIMKLPINTLQRLIRISGPYKQKAKRIKQISKTILENYKGKVPNTREELMKLYGVGYKTSAIVLMYGFNIPAIAVDVHVEVCSKRLGLASKDAKPQEIEKELEKIFPKNKWYLINLGFVSFGKEICKPTPICIKDPKNCPFSGFCKAYKTKKFKLV